MGFDIYGLKAKSERGKYFRNNVWWWRPLATYVLKFCSIPKKERKDGWSFNDGLKISEKTALDIAKQLEILLKLGHTANYKKQYDKYLKQLPLRACTLCNGIGIRNDKILKGVCNSCNGKGKVKDWDCSYPFSTTNVREFMKFCKESGGFEIY